MAASTQYRVAIYPSIYVYLSNSMYLPKSVRVELIFQALNPKPQTRFQVLVPIKSYPHRLFASAHVHLCVCVCVYVCVCVCVCVSSDLVIHGLLLLASILLRPCANLHRIPFAVAARLLVRFCAHHSE